MKPPIVSIAYEMPSTRFKLNDVMGWISWLWRILIPFRMVPCALPVVPAGSHVVWYVAFAPKPFRADLFDQRREMLEENVIPFDRTQNPQLAPPGELREDTRGVQLAEVP